MSLQPQNQVLILGGTGRVGQLVISQLLNSNIPTTALIRKPDSLTPQANLTLQTGSPLSSTTISQALTTMQSNHPSSKITIISTLGQTRVSGNPWSATTSPPRFMAESAQAVVEAIRSLTPGQQSKISKFIQLSMFGAKESMGNLNFLMRGVMSYSNMAQTVEDHNLTSDVIIDNFMGLDGPGKREGELPIPYVLVRPAMLKFGAEIDGEVKVHGDRGAGAGFMPSIQARDVARFLVETVTSKAWDGRTPVISN